VKIWLAVWWSGDHDFGLEVRGACRGGNLSQGVAGGRVEGRRGGVTVPLVRLPAEPLSLSLVSFSPGIVFFLSSPMLLLSLDEPFPRLMFLFRFVSDLDLCSFSLFLLASRIP
jgi:hypothetical protein